MIVPQATSILKLLQGNSFQIPRYQRDYEWGKSEATEFINDLNESAQGEDQLFLGTIILSASGKKAANGGIIDQVVDGQQRLTTIFLLLMACRERAKILSASGMVNRIQERIGFSNEVTGEYIGCRLIASDSIRDVFEYIADDKWMGDFPARIARKPVKRQANKLKPIYDYFYSEVSDKDQVFLNSFLEAIYKAYVVLIGIENEEEAFSIFERTNARGVDLEASDLLKNYLFSRGVDNLEDKWTEVTNLADGDLLRMLKFYCVSQKGRVRKSDLYKSLKTYGKEAGAAKLIDELQAFAKYFHAIRNGNQNDLQRYYQELECNIISGNVETMERLYCALEGLRLFKIVQIYPLIYAATECFRRSGGNADKACMKKYVGLFEMLEKYHFINTAICGKLGNKVENLYADTCAKYQESSDFIGTTDTLINNLKEHLATEQEFVSSFATISYSTKQLSMINYIFDRLNNHGRDMAGRVRIFNPGNEIHRRLYNVEHFYPVNPKEPIPADIQEVIDSIGNLMVIGLKDNSRLNNLSPMEKIAKLSEQKMARNIENLLHVQDFLHQYGPAANQNELWTWGRTAIERRTINLAQEAYKQVWKFG